jgi:ADP-heptose:LPS heptosyltransferase
VHLNKETLFIHLGGLGDLCLSESVLFSLSHHFKKPIVGLGTKRILSLFEEYLSHVHGIESARWLYLFSDGHPGTVWERIVFVGKDKDGELRRKWQKFSRMPLLFIEMYPDGTFEEMSDGGRGTRDDRTTKDTGEDGQSMHRHVEDYQLAQLHELGIEAMRKEPLPRPGRRVILYPERGYKKRKWREGNFIRLYQSLRSRGVEAYLLESPGLDVDLPARLILPELSQIKTLFEGGGIFVSNDSGMAHLAGMCGLTTITIFTDFDSRMWHPRGANISLQHGRDPLDPSLVEEIILRAYDGVPA